jgi:cytochrome c5
VRHLLTWAVAALLSPAAGAATDLHDYWDSRCRECHGDSAAFARSTLRVEGGRLLGRHHTEGLATFLRQHYLSDDLLVPVMQMLQAQVTTSPVFKEKCAGCHGTAADFARESLVMRDGVLVGRVSGRAVRDDLQRHGKLAPSQVAPMVATLERVLGEVGGR